MKTEEMNKGVQILLERMQSNPEEFIPDWRGSYPPKWSAKLNAIARRASHITNAIKEVDYYPELPFLKDEEILALWNAMQNLLANQFTEEVMATLLHDAEELSPSFEQVLNEPPKRKLHKVTALDIKVAKELGMSLNDYIATKDQMGITT
jgi:hypothetical protein